MNNNKQVVREDPLMEDLGMDFKDFQGLKDSMTNSIKGVVKEDLDKLEGQGIHSKTFLRNLKTSLVVLDQREVVNVVNISIKLKEET